MWLAVVICPQTDSTGSSEATSDRQDCGGCSANEAEASGGFEHWEVVPYNSRSVSQNRADRERVDVPARNVS